MHLGVNLEIFVLLVQLNITSHFDSTLLKLHMCVNVCQFISPLKCNKTWFIPPQDAVESNFSYMPPNWSIHNWSIQDDDVRIWYLNSWHLNNIDEGSLLSCKATEGLMDET